jgi:hypothetical protein
MSSKIERRREGRRLLTEDREHRWRGARSRHAAPPFLCALYASVITSSGSNYRADPSSSLLVLGMHASICNFLLDWYWFGFNRAHAGVSSEARDRQGTSIRRGSEIDALWWFFRLKLPYARGNMHACHVCYIWFGNLTIWPFFLFSVVYLVIGTTTKQNVSIPTLATNILWPVSTVVPLWCHRTVCRCLRP